MVCKDARHDCSHKGSQKHPLVAGVGHNPSSLSADGTWGKNLNNLSKDQIQFS